MKTKKSPEADDACFVSMLAVVAEAEVRKANDGYYSFKTKDPTALYLNLEKAGAIAKGDFSGVTREKTAKFRKVEGEYISTSDGYWESDSISGPCPRHWVEGTGYREMHDVFDGYEIKTTITTSTRADIRQSDGYLYVAKEAISERGVKWGYMDSLKSKPVGTLLSSLVGEKAGKSLVDAFRTLRSLRPLSVEETADTGKVTALQRAYDKAAKGLEKAVTESGLRDILDQDQLKDLVSRGMKMAL